MSAALACLLADAAGRPQLVPGAAPWQPAWLARFERLSRLPLPVRFVRGTARTCLGPDGVLVTRPAGVAAFAHDGAGRPLGLACDPPRSNSLRSSRALGDLGAWTHNNGLTVAQNATGLDAAANVAWTVSDPTAAANAWLGQQIDIPSAVADHASSVHVRKATAPGALLRFEQRLQGGTVHHCGLWLDPQSGTATVDGTLDAPVVATVRDRGGWWELGLGATNGGGNTQLSFRLRPAAGFTPGNVATSATGSIVVDFPQVHLGARRVTGGPIATTAAPVARAGDEADIELAALGPAFSFAAAWTADGADDELCRVVEFNDGSVANQVALLRAGGSVALNVVTAGGFEASLALGPWSAGRHAVAARIAPDGIAACLDGGTLALDGDATVPPLASLLLGRSIASSWLGAPLGAVGLWRGGLPDRALAALAAGF